MIEGYEPRDLDKKIFLLKANTQFSGWKQFPPEPNRIMTEQEKNSLYAVLYWFYYIVFPHPDGVILGAYQMPVVINKDTNEEVKRLTLLEARDRAIRDIETIIINGVDKDGPHKDKPFLEILPSSNMKSPDLLAFPEKVLH